MSLPTQFDGNYENIRIYHYVEELVADYKEHLVKSLDETEISYSEVPILIRIRFLENTTQKDLTKLFKVSKGYIARLLRKFEDEGLITREEHPDNHRIKVVKLTAKGYEITDKLVNLVDQWEFKVTKSLSEEETKTLKKLLYKLVVNK